MMKTDEKPMSKLSGLLSWLDHNLLFIAVSFLIVFIPLYPKIPLADLIPGYIVRMRLEDLLILGTFGFWLLQVLRKKISLKNPLTKIIIAYLIVGLLSCISAIFITNTVPESKIHIQKLFLHYFRRIQYFSLFFIAVSAVRSVKQIKMVIGLFLIGLFSVSLYGLGQKYLYWPVYSTMNREFSKGLRLYLTEHARVQSTFGGHYDFAAFLVIGLPLTLAVLFFVRSRLIKLGLGITYLLGLWGMMMTASRSSFLAFLTSIIILCVYWLKTKGFLWLIPRGIFIFSTTFIFMFTFGGMSERFGQIFKDNSTYASISTTIEDVKNKAQLPLVAPPKEGISIDDVNKAAEEAAKRAAEDAAKRAAIAAKNQNVIDVTDTMPSVSPVESILPADVYVDIPAAIISTKSAEGKDIEVIVPRVFSENAHRLGLSAAIRLDTLWPYAIRGFLRNPLLGSGYSTLTKTNIGDFTEAESTDNDFLRTLGETGALGFLTFYGTMILGLSFLIRVARRHKDKSFSLMTISMVAITAGLFVNAIYIDVFVSSKVIQTYWMLTGLSIAWAMLIEAQHVPSHSGGKLNQSATSKQSIPKKSARQRV